MLRANRRIYLIEFIQSFGFLGLKFSLVLYLVNRLGMADKLAYQVYAVFTAFAYGMSPIFGYLSEKYFGCKFAIFLGYIFLFISYGLFIIGNNEYFALSAFICGIGLYRTNLYDLLGKINQDNEKQSFISYNNLIIFFNLGAVMSLIFIGSDVEDQNWQAVFKIFGGVTFISFLIFIFSLRDIFKEVEVYQFSKMVFPFIGIIIFLLFFPGLVERIYIADYFFISLILITLLISIYIYLAQDKQNRKNLLILGLLFLFLISTNVAFEQIGSSLSLLIDRVVDRNCLGFVVPTTWILSLNPIFYTVFGGMVFLISLHLKPEWFQNKIYLLFVICFIFLISAYGLLWLVTLSGNGNSISMFFMGSVLMFYTFAEVIISPISLSMIYILSPKKYTNFFMGVWFLVFSFSNYLSGEVASYISVEDIMDKSLLFEKYNNFFEFLSIFLVLNLIFLYYSRKLINRKG